LVVLWVISKLSHLPVPSRSIDQFQRCDFHVTRSDPTQNPSIFQLFLSHLSIKVSTKTLEPKREWCHEEEEEEGNALTSSPRLFRLMIPPSSSSALKTNQESAREEESEWQSPYFFSSRTWSPSADENDDRKTVPYRG
jgi:hypothetical protein